MTLIVSSHSGEKRDVPIQSVNRSIHNPLNQYRSERRAPLPPEEKRVIHVVDIRAYPLSIIPSSHWTREIFPINGRPRGKRSLPCSQHDTGHIETTRYGTEWLTMRITPTCREMISLYLPSRLIPPRWMEGWNKPFAYSRKKRFLVWTGSEYIYGFPNSNCALANSTIESGGMQLVKDVIFRLTV